MTRPVCNNMPANQKTIRHFANNFFAGGLAGFTALGIDQLLAILTLGHWLPLAPRFAAAYPISGIALAGLIAGARLLARKARWRWEVLCPVALAAIYSLSIFERVFSEAKTLFRKLGHVASFLAPLLDPRPLLALQIVSALVAIAGLLLWFLLLGRIIGSRSFVPSLWIGTLTVAVGLAVNRNVIDVPISLTSLALDATILFGSVAVAYLTRLIARRRLIALGAALVTAMAAIAALVRPVPTSNAVSPSATPDRHLILVVIDTLRLDVFDAVVAETEEGRAFKRAIDGAAWFSNAISTAPWTAPSVGSILTGLYPMEHGLVASRGNSNQLLGVLPPEIPTLAEHLSHQGYRTEGIGTNTIIQPAIGLTRGFLRYELLSCASARLPLLTALRKFGLLQAEVYQPAGAVHRELSSRLGEMARSGHPFFLWLHLMDPHEPQRRHRGLSPDPKAAGLPEIERLYRDETRYVLQEIAGITDLLREHGLWEQTGLIVVSDHGEMFPSDDHDIGLMDRRTDRPKIYGHGHALYGELARVPLVIRPPGGLPEARRIETLTSLVDLHDTALDLLGVEAPRIGGDRVSLAPWLEQERPTSPPPERTAALISSTFDAPEQRGLRTASLKLIEYLEGERPMELYEITSDPTERNDLANSKPDWVRSSAVRLEDLWSELRETPETPQTQEMTIDPETRRRLEALGYLND